MTEYAKIYLFLTELRQKLDKSTFILIDFGPVRNITKKSRRDLQTAICGVNQQFSRDECVFKINVAMKLRLINRFNRFIVRRLLYLDREVAA